MDNDLYKNCPHCSGKIKAAAKKCKHCKSFLVEAPVRETTPFTFSESTVPKALKYYSIVDVRIIYCLIAASAILLILFLFTGLKLLRNESNDLETGQEIDSSSEHLNDEQRRPFYLDMITVKDDPVVNDEEVNDEIEDSEIVPAVEPQIEETPTYSVAQQNQISETPSAGYFNPQDLSDEIPEWLSDEIERHINFYQNGSKFFKWGYDDGFKWALNFPDLNRLLFHNYTGSVAEKFRAEQARGVSTGGEYWFVDNSLIEYRNGWNLGVRGYLLTLFLKAALEEIEG